jgi:hypothetical protein
LKPFTIAIAIRAYTEAIAIGQKSGDRFSLTLAISGLGHARELGLLSPDFGDLMPLSNYSVLNFKTSVCNS